MTQLPATQEDTLPEKRSGVRIAVQVVGFLVGIGLLGWCVRLALSDENREALSKLADEHITITRRMQPPV